MNTNDHKPGHKDTKFLNLNASELSILSDRDFLLIKRGALEKIVKAFARLETNIQEQLPHFWKVHQPVKFRTRGKISKGENYLGLPFVILDCPAVFSKDGVAAFRTLYWWGHGFSITFHISGCYLNAMPEEFFKRLLDHCPEHYLIGIGDGEWDHHFEASNFTGIGKQNLTQKQIQSDSGKRGFLKIADTWETGQADETPVRVISFMKNLSHALYAL